MASIRCKRVVNIGKGDFKEIAEYVPQLSHAVKSYHVDDDKRYTSYAVSLVQTDNAFLAVLQVTENYTFEVGVGDGAVDYYDGEFYYGIAEVLYEDVAACGYESGATDRKKLLNIVLKNGWESFSCDDVSFDIDEAARITRLTIPKTVTSLDELDFSLRELEYIEVEPGNSVFSAKDGVLYSFDGKTLIFCPIGMESVTVAPETNGLADEAFMYWEGKSITLPVGLDGIGRDCFAFCPNVEKIILPDTVRSVGNRAFWHCDSLKEVHLSDSMMDVPAELFRACRNLERVNIPKNAEDMGYHAFSLCEKLTHVTFPKSFWAVGEHAYWRCASLKSVHFEGNAKIWREAFSGCAELESVTVSGEVLGIGQDAFAYCPKMQGIKKAD